MEEKVTLYEYENGILDEGDRVLDAIIDKRQEFIER